jgi:tRNA pseudouridine65 synthase
MDILARRGDDWIAVAKPSGWVVHRNRLTRGAPSCLAAAREAFGRQVYPVHRLDRGTSGVLLLALTSEAAGRLGALFRQKKVRKTYYAVVRGWVPEAGEIDKSLRRAEGKEPRPALSRYARAAQVELPAAVGRYATARYSLVRVETETGRLHQVRLHLRSIAHPVIGDVVHGDGAHNRFFRERFGIRRLLLHAARLELDGQVIDAPWPAELAELFSVLGWKI